MSMEFIKKIPTAEEIMEQMPLPNHIKEIKRTRDSDIRKVFENENDKFILIIGPCSADNEDSVCEYIEKLVKVQEKVKESIIIIPRIYTNKPRTTGEGYKGMAHQPDPSKKPDLVAGITAIRQLHIKALSEFHMPAADEMLYPENYLYLYEDLIRIAREYEKQKLLNPSIIVDTSHANSMKLYEEQPRIAREVLMSRKYDPLLKKMVKGFMIESYLEEGKQDVGSGIYGKSITDACLGWGNTEKLIYYIAENL